MSWACGVYAFSQGDRGLVGPPGEKAIIKILPKMKADMKGPKGDHGKMGEPGFPGPRGDYNHIYFLLKNTKGSILNMQGLEFKIFMLTAIQNIY